MIKNLGSRIKEAQKAAGITQEKAARELNIALPTLNKYIKGHRVPDAILLSHMAKLFKCDPAWLLTGEGDMTIAGANVSRQLKGVRQTPKPFNDKTTPPDGFILVPHYDVEAAAGAGTVIHSEQVVDSLAFRAQWIKELGLTPDALALISTRGDSMEPTLHPGDLLLIDLSSAAVCEDAIYAIQNDGSLVVKRVQKMFDGSMLIKSDNPAYREQVIEKERLETVRIIGRVVWAGRRL